MKNLGRRKGEAGKNISKEPGYTTGIAVEISAKVVPINGLQSRNNLRASENNQTARTSE